MVPEISLRSGYRAERHDKKGICTAKVKRQQQIETLVLPTPHVDALDALFTLQYPPERVAEVINVEGLESDDDDSASDRYESDDNGSNSGISQ